MTVARIRLGGLAVVCLAAGVLPWLLDGPAAGRYLGIPFFAVAVLAVLGLTRRPNRPGARPLSSYPLAQPGGCACGSGGCCGGAPAESLSENESPSDEESLSGEDSVTTPVDGRAART